MMTPSAASRRGRYRVYLDPIECGRINDAPADRPYLEYRRMSGHEMIDYAERAESISTTSLSLRERAAVACDLLRTGLVGHGNIARIATGESIAADATLSDDDLLDALDINDLVAVVYAKVRGNALDLAGKDDWPSQSQSPGDNSAEDADPGSVSVTPVTTAVPRLSVRHAAGAAADSATAGGSGI